jgi:hypothetical protein
MSPFDIHNNCITLAEFQAHGHPHPELITDVVRQEDMDICAFPRLRSTDPNISYQHYRGQRPQQPIYEYIRALYLLQASTPDRTGTSIKQRKEHCVTII